MDTHPRPHGPGANAAALGLHTPARGLAFLAGYGHGRATCEAEREQLRRAIGHLVAATAELGDLVPGAVTADIIPTTEAQP